MASSITKEVMVLATVVFGHCSIWHSKKMGIQTITGDNKSKVHFLNSELAWRRTS